MTYNDNNNVIKSTSDIIESTYINLIRGITGLATSDKKGLIFSVSKILQNVRATDLLISFKKEWDSWKDKGTIKDDYSTTEQHLNCLHELLNFLDNDIPDKLRFDILKKILFVAASETISKRDDVLPHQFMQISKNLNSGEFMVLFTAYNLAKSSDFKFPENLSAHRWAELIAENSPLKYSSLVQLYEDNLIKYKLLYDRMYNDKSGIQMSQHLSLTSLGLDFCRYVEQYDNVKP